MIVLENSPHSSIFSNADILQQHHWFNLPSAEQLQSPYWWCVTSQIWIVLLLLFETFLNIPCNQKHYPDLASGTSSVIRTMELFLRWGIEPCSDVNAKCREFSQAKRIPASKRKKMIIILETKISETDSLSFKISWYLRRCIFILMCFCWNNTSL